MNSEWSKFFVLLRIISASSYMVCTMNEKTLDYKNTKNFGLVVYLVALSNISDLCQNWSRNFQYFYLVNNGDNIQILAYVELGEVSGDCATPLRLKNP